MSDIDSVTLQSAFHWSCPKCNNKNYGDTLPLNMQQREMAYRALNEMEHWQELPDDWNESEELEDYTMAPSVVVCSKCGELYKVQEDSASGWLHDDIGDDDIYFD